MSYAPRILKDGQADYDGIRDAAGLDDKELTNGTILSTTYLPAVEAGMVKDYPKYASMALDDNLLLRSAVTKLVAAIALNREPKSEASLEYKYTFDRQEQIQKLVDGALDDMAKITVPRSQIKTAGHFRIGGPTRDRKASGDWIYATVLFGGTG